MYTLPYDIKKPLTTHIVKGSYTYTNAKNKSICSYMYQPITRGYPVPSQAGLLT